MIPMESPNVTVSNSPTVGVVTRSAIQLLSGSFFVEGIELFLYDFTDDQAKWATGAFTLLIVGIQNAIEFKRNRKFIGAAPVPAVAPEPPEPEGH